MKSFALNVAKNRGNSRVWIEGNRLLDMGITKGIPYAKQYLDCGSIALIFYFGHDTSNMKVSKVAGTATRPIIDICNRSVTAIMGDAKRYSVTCTKADTFIFMVIEPIRESEQV